MPPSAMSSTPATIELRRSRALCAALVGLGLAAGASVAMSDASAWVLLLVPVLLGMGWPRASRWAAVTFSASGAVTMASCRDAAAPMASSDGMAEPIALQVRGRLAVLSLRIDGRVNRFVLTLGADQRRQLALWFERHGHRASRTGWAAHV